MKITVFTSNHRRHNHYINTLIEKGYEVFAIIEVTTLLSGLVKDHFESSVIFSEYFKSVLQAEFKTFPEDRYIKKCNKLISLRCGDLSHLTKQDLDGFLDSDYFLTFGCSYIKGWLADYLIKKKCLNIHMGISPFYRGANCNFWASYDQNYEYVGGTIHFLSKGLDSGPIIKLVFPSIDKCDNPFDFSMRSVKTSQEELIKIIEENIQLKYIISYEQDNNKLIRYAKNKEFNDIVAKNFLDRKDSIDLIKNCKKRVESDSSHPLFDFYKHY